MTLQEFQNTQWFNNKKVLYTMTFNGKEFPPELRNVGSVDFAENLIGLVNKDDPENPFDFVRHENCNLI